MRHTRYGLLAAYAFVLMVSIVVYGVPLDRLGITLWVLAGLTVYSVGRGFRYFVRILLDWIPFTAVLFLYDYTRGLAFFMVRAPWWRRFLLSVYPLAMGLALVYSGEHYVVDVLAGIAYAVAIIGGWQVCVRLRASSNAGRAGSPINRASGHREPRAGPLTCGIGNLPTEVPCAHHSLSLTSSTARSPSTATGPRSSTNRISRPHH